MFNSVQLAPRQEEERRRILVDLTTCTGRLLKKKAQYPKRRLSLDRNYRHRESNLGPLLPTTSTVATPTTTAKLEQENVVIEPQSDVQKSPDGK